MAEVRGSRTHLSRFAGTHAALKAGEDTGLHPPPNIKKSSPKTIGELEFRQIKPAHYPAFL